MASATNESEQMEHLFWRFFCFYGTILAIFIKILVAIILAIFFFQLAIHGDFFPPPGDGHKKKVEALVLTV